MFKVIRTFKQNIEHYPKKREWNASSFDEAVQILEEDLEKVKKFKKGVKFSCLKQNGEKEFKGIIIKDKTTGSYSEPGEKIKHEIETDYKIKDFWEYTIEES